MEIDHPVQEASRRKEDFVSSILEWSKDNLRSFPWRENPTPYSVLVAEILLRRTTATAVSRIFPLFMETYPSLESLSKAAPTELESMLSTIGYQKKRAAILNTVAAYILKEFQTVPSTKEDLLQIPHVGHYTAGAILSIGYGIPSGMVDSNVERIFRRYFCNVVANTGRFSLLRKIADLLVPQKNHTNYNYALLDIGALICKYGRPRCEVCPLKRTCDHFTCNCPSNNL